MMHISGKIMIPIGIVLMVIAAIIVFTFDGEEYLQQLDQDGELTIELFDEDQAGELGFSFWIKGEYIDADDNGLWDDCEEFNASVTGAEGIKDADTERFQPICDEKDEEWDDLGLIKVGQACNSVVKENEDGTLEVDSPMRCPDGEYLITANADSKVRYDDAALGEFIWSWIAGGCCCCFGLIIILLGVGFGFSMNPSTSQFATMEFSSGSVAPLPTDDSAVTVPGTVPGTVFGAGPTAQITDTPATGGDAEEIQSSADSLKEQFLSAAADKVTATEEPEKE